MQTIHKFYLLGLFKSALLAVLACMAAHFLNKYYSIDPVIVNCLQISSFIFWGATLYAQIDSWNSSAEDHLWDHRLSTTFLFLSIITGILGSQLKP